MSIKTGTKQRRSGRRCGTCYWALYDGEWCQNPDCERHRQSCGEGEVISGLTTDEAMVLIGWRKSGPNP